MCISTFIHMFLLLCVYLYVFLWTQLCQNDGWMNGCRMYMQTSTQRVPVYCYVQSQTGDSSGSLIIERMLLGL